MSIAALRNRSIRTIKLELEFLRDTAIIDPTTLSRIVALLPEPETIDKTTDAPSAPVVKTTPEPVKKPWPPVATSAGTGVAAPVKPPLPTRPSASTAPEKSAVPSVPPPDLPPPPSYSSENICKATWAYEQKDPTDLAFEKDELIIILDKGDGKWVYGRSRDTGREGWVPNNRIEPATEQDIREWEQKHNKPPIPGSHDPNMMTNVAYGKVENSGFSAPAPPQQEEGKGKSKLEENGKKFGSKLGNAAIFGAGATIGSKIVSGIF